MEATSRFGWALVASATVITVVGTGLYIRDPTPLQPSRVGSSFAKVTFFEKGSGAPAGSVSTLVRFFDAVERGDITRMRLEFPRITTRERRILGDIRGRLGAGADLEVKFEKVHWIDDDELEIDFVVLAKRSGRELRLPFNAELRLTGDAWKITRLR